MFVFLDYYYILKEFSLILKFFHIVTWVTGKPLTY